jgi:hypothetical protein
VVRKKRFLDSASGNRIGFFTGVYQACQKKKELQRKEPCKTAFAALDSHRPELQRLRKKGKWRAKSQKSIPQGLKPTIY